MQPPVKEHVGRRTKERYDDDVPPRGRTEHRYDSYHGDAPPRKDYPIQETTRTRNVEPSSRSTHGSRSRSRTDSRSKSQLSYGRETAASYSKTRYTEYPVKYNEGYESGYSNDELEENSKPHGKERYEKKKVLRARWSKDDDKKVGGERLTPTTGYDKYSEKFDYSKRDSHPRDYDSREIRVRQPLRDIDARVEKVPTSYFGARKLKEKDGYVSVEDQDGKTTFYHYTDKTASRNASLNSSSQTRLRSKTS